MRTCLSIALVLLTASAFAEERLSGSNVDVRTTLAFKVSDAQLQKLLPEGWEPNSPTSGPAKGANLNLVLIDQAAQQDAQGASLKPVRGVAVAVPVKKRGTDIAAAMVVGGLFEPHGAPGAYGVYLPAQVTSRRTQSAGTDGKSMIEESWQFRGGEGNAVDLQLQFERGLAAPSKVESKTYSAAHPDFFRIYRFEAVSDVARSVPAGIDRVVRISFKASGPQLAALFDGSEQLISVTSIPSYSRKVFLPAP